MYPGVIVEYNDQSARTPLPVTEVRNRPLFGAVFTSDKGPEEWTRVSGRDFFDIYGETISYARHGQPLLQAAMTINAGGELLCKRLVADTAHLANIGIVAKVVTITEVEETEAQEEETEAPSTIVIGAKIVYSIKSATNVDDIKAAKESIEASLEEGEHLLYVIADNGRGTSKKRIKILPNYRLSRSLNYTLYTLSVIEGSTELESMTFSINPNIVNYMQMSI